MKTDIIIAGVGGQGILTIAAILDIAALNNGLVIKQAEVHGMSQRGGMVQSHLRISSDRIYSDLIPQGKADLILSLELQEGMRYLPYLSEVGMLISTTNSLKSDTNYPDEVSLLQELKRLPNSLVLDIVELEKKTGNRKTGNVILLGAASRFINLPKDSFLKAIDKHFKNKGLEVIEMNKEAFLLGYEVSGRSIVTV